MPAVTRHTDADVVHCDTPYRDDHSPDVICNGLGISRVGDKNTTHLLPGSPCPSHAAPIESGSASVIVNGQGCGRIGDPITNCTSVAQGSPDVFAGD